MTAARSSAYVSRSLPSQGWPERRRSSSSSALIAGTRCPAITFIWGIPGIGVQRPAVGDKDTGWPYRRVLVEDLRAVLGSGEGHAPPPSRARPDPARTLDMSLGSDVDTPARREGTSFCRLAARLTSRGKGTYRGRPRGLRGVAAPVPGPIISGMRMTLPAEWPVSTTRWAFAASLERGRPLRPGVRRWLPAHPAGGGGRRPRPARHRHRSALMRGDGIPWLAARRSGCPRSGVRVLTTCRSGCWSAGGLRAR